MLQAADPIGVAVFLAVFVKAALDRIAGIVRSRWPNAELTLPFGIAALVLGAAVGWLANINIFTVLPQMTVSDIFGRALTALAVGLGAEFINDVLAVVQGRRSSPSATMAVRGYRATAVRGW